MVKIRAKAIKPKLQKDFKKKKAKVGRKIARDNVTKIDVKTRRINMPLQASITLGNPQTEREQLNKLFKLLNHYNAHNRIQALTDIRNILTSSRVADSYATLVIPKVMERLFDEEKETRDVLVSMMKYMCTQFPSKSLEASAVMLVNYICSGLTTLTRDIRRDSITILNVIALTHGSILASCLDQIFENLLGFLGESSLVTQAQVKSESKTVQDNNRRPSKNILPKKTKSNVKGNKSTNDGEWANRNNTLQLLLTVMCNLLTKSANITRVMEAMNDSSQELDKGTISAISTSTSMASVPRVRRRHTALIFDKASNSRAFKRTKIATSDVSEGVESSGAGDDKAGGMSRDYRKGWLSIALEVTMIKHFQVTWMRLVLRGSALTEHETVVLKLIADMSFLVVQRELGLGLDHNDRLIIGVGDESGSNGTIDENSLRYNIHVLLVIMLSSFPYICKELETTSAEAPHMQALVHKVKALNLCLAETFLLYARKGKLPLHIPHKVFVSASMLTSPITAAASGNDIAVAVNNSSIAYGGSGLQQEVVQADFFVSTVSVVEGFLMELLEDIIHSKVKSGVVTREREVSDDDADSEEEEETSEEEGGEEASKEDKHESRKEKAGVGSSEAISQSARMAPQLFRCLAFFIRPSNASMSLGGTSYDDGDDDDSIADITLSFAPNRQKSVLLPDKGKIILDKIRQLITATAAQCSFSNAVAGGQGGQGECVAQLGRAFIQEVLGPALHCLCTMSRRFTDASAVWVHNTSTAKSSMTYNEKMMFLSFLWHTFTHIPLLFTRWPAVASRTSIKKKKDKKRKLEYSREYCTTLYLLALEGLVSRVPQHYWSVSSNSNGDNGSNVEIMPGQGLEVNVPADMEMLRRVLRNLFLRRRPARSNNVTTDDNDNDDETKLLLQGIPLGHSMFSLCDSERRTILLNVYSRIQSPQLLWEVSLELVRYYGQGAISSSSSSLSRVDKENGILRERKHFMNLLYCRRHWLSLPQVVALLNALLRFHHEALVRHCQHLLENGFDDIGADSDGHHNDRKEDMQLYFTNLALKLSSSSSVSSSVSQVWHDISTPTKPEKIVNYFMKEWQGDKYAWCRNLLYGHHQENNSTHTAGDGDQGNKQKYWYSGQQVIRYVTASSVFGICKKLAMPCVSALDGWAHLHSSRDGGDGHDGTSIKDTQNSSNEDGEQQYCSSSVFSAHMHIDLLDKAALTTALCPLMAVLMESIMVTVYTSEQMNAYSAHHLGDFTVDNGDIKGSKDDKHEEGNVNASIRSVASVEKHSKEANYTVHLMSSVVKWLASPCPIGRLHYGDIMNISELDRVQEEMPLYLKEFPLFICFLESILLKWSIVTDTHNAHNAASTSTSSSSSRHDTMLDGKCLIAALDNTLHHHLLQHIRISCRSYLHAYLMLMSKMAHERTNLTILGQPTDESLVVLMGRLEECVQDFSK